MPTLDTPHGWNGGSEIFPIAWDDHDVVVRLDIESDVALVVQSMDDEDRGRFIVNAIQNPKKEIHEVALRMFGLDDQTGQQQFISRLAEEITAYAEEQNDEWREAGVDTTEFQHLMPFTNRSKEEMDAAIHRIVRLSSDQDAMLEELYQAMVNRNYAVIEVHIAMNNKKVFDMMNHVPCVSPDKAKNMVETWLNNNKPKKSGMFGKVSYKDKCYYVQSFVGDCVGPMTDNVVG